MTAATLQSPAAEYPAPEFERTDDVGSPYFETWAGEWSGRKLEVWIEFDRELGVTTGVDILDGRGPLEPAAREFLERWLVDELRSCEAEED